MRICPGCGRQMEGFPEICEQCGQTLPEPELTDPFAPENQPEPQKAPPVMRYRGGSQTEPDENPQSDEILPEEPTEPGTPKKILTPEQQRIRKKMRLLALLTVLAILLGFCLWQYRSSLFRRGAAADSFICYASDGAAYYWDENLGKIKLPDSFQTRQSEPWSSDSDAFISGNITRSKDKTALFYPDMTNRAAFNAFTLCRFELADRFAKAEPLIPDPSYEGCCTDYRLLNEDGSEIVMVFRRGFAGYDSVYTYRNKHFTRCGDYPIGSVTLINDESLLNGSAFYLVTNEPTKDLTERYREMNLLIEDDPDAPPVAEQMENRRLPVSDANLRCYAISQLYSASGFAEPALIGENIIDFAMPDGNHRYLFTCSCESVIIPSENDDADDEISWQPVSLAEGTEVKRIDLSGESEARSLLWHESVIVPKTILPYADGSCFLYTTPVSESVYSDTAHFGYKDFMYLEKDGMLIQPRDPDGIIDIGASYGDVPAALLYYTSGETALIYGSKEIMIDRNNVFFSQDGRYVYTVQNTEDDAESPFVLEAAELIPDKVLVFRTAAAYPYFSSAHIISGDALVFCENDTEIGWTMYLNDRVLKEHCFPGAVEEDTARSRAYVSVENEDKSGMTLYRLENGDMVELAVQAFESHQRDFRLDKQTGDLYVLDKDKRLLCPGRKNPVIAENVDTLIFNLFE